MDKNYFTLFFCLFIFLLPSYLFAQINLKENTLNFNSGLSSDNVSNTVKKENYLFVATHNGLSMYDGYRFINHTTITSKITNLKVKNNKIYFYDVIKGLCSLDKFHQKATIIAANKYTDSTPNNDHYENIFVDSQNRVWCSDASYIKYFRGNEKSLFGFDIKNTNIEKPITILEIKNSKIWFATYKGLYVWNSKTNTISLHHNTNLAKLNITAAYYSSNENTLYLTTFNGLFLAYKIESNQIEKIANIPEGAKILKIQISIKNSKNKFLLNSDKYIFEVQQDKSELLKLYDSKNIKINDVQADDKTHNLWVSTNRGLIQLYNNPNILNLILPTKNPKIVVSVVQDANETIFAALDSNEIWSLEKDKNWVKYNIPNGVCKNLSVHKNKILIASTNGLFSIENRQLKEIKIPHFTRKIKKCIVDFNNNLWILPIEEKVSVFDFETLQPKDNYVQNPNSFWEGNQWNDILCDNFGTVWMAGWMPKSHGILKFDAENNIFLDIAKFSKNRKGKNNFVADYFNRIAVTNNDDLLFSSHGGWNRIDKKGNVISAYPSDVYKLASHHLEGICEDSSKNIWFATAEGLYVFTKQLEKTIRFSQIDGLHTDELINGFCKLKNEKIALGNENGLSIVNTKEALKQNISSNLKLTAVTIDGKMLNQIPETIFLSNTSFQIVLAFSDLTYSNKIKVNYRYKFKDEKKWNFLGNNAELSFVKLPPGHHNLIIENGDNSNQWTKKPLEINVFIEPKFNQTWWFKGLVALLIILLVWGLNKYLLQQQKIKNDLTQEIQNAEMKTLRSQMNPHFMFNTLNSINSYIIQNKSNEASKYITMFSKLVRNILDNSKHAEITLEKEIQALKLYMQLEAVRLDNKFDYSINIADNVDEETVKIPPLILQPFVENAIWHGLHNKKEHGNLKINISSETETILNIQIIDNGVGRKATSMIKKQQTNHKSYGIEITVSRLKMLNEENTVELIDLYDNKGIPNGTQVNLKIYF